MRFGSIIYIIGIMFMVGFLKQADVTDNLEVAKLSVLWPATVGGITHMYIEGNYCGETKND